ncbi:MAG TPA: hypothetical protein VJZ27_11195, partial [Aggregatilineales bacterium]|nr:hypothetical protein [Aggregatilineales bacterium]
KSFVNGLFMYLSLKALGRSPAASCIGALAWMLSWALGHQTQTTYNEGVGLMPAVFFLTIRSYQSESRRKQLIFGIIAAVFAGFQFLAGNIQMTVYSFVMLFAFAVFYSWQSRTWRPVVTLIVVYAAGILVGAVQLMSSYELLGLSIRGVSQTHQNKGIEPYTSLSFLNPWIYFWRNFEFPELRDKYWLTYRWNPFIGLIPLLGVGLALRFVKDHTARFIAFVSIGVYALLHILYFRPVFDVVSRIPGYDIIDQTRFLIVLPFPLVIVAAYGIDWLLDEGQTRWRELRPILILASLVIPIMAALMIAGIMYFSSEKEAAANLGDTFAEQRIKIGTDIIADYYHIKNPLFAVSFIFAAAGLAIVTGYARGNLSRKITEWMLIGAVAVEMVFFAQVNIASTPSDLIYPTTPAIEWLLQKSENEIFRIGAAPHDLYAGRETGNYSEYRNDHGWFLSSLLP